MWGMGNNRVWGGNDSGEVLGRSTSTVPPALRCVGGDQAPGPFTPVGGQSLSRVEGREGRIGTQSSKAPMMFPHTRSSSVLWPHLPAVWAIFSPHFFG